MDIERSIDGMVGRLMSWLTLAPIRAREDRAEDPAESRAEAPAEVVEAMVETVEEVAGAVAGKAEETGEAEAAARAQLRKYLGLEAETVRPLHGPPEPGDDRAEVWMFRIESLPAGDSS